MIIVDTHCHAGLSWFEPVELLLFQMNRNDVSKAVLTQHMGTFAQAYLIECRKLFPGRFAATMLVDASRNDAPQVMEKWTSAGMDGVRLGPTVRSSGPDPLAVWRKASELGLIVSSFGTVEEFAAEAFSDLVAELPNLTIIIEHLGGVAPGEKPPYTIFKKALSLSRFPNTYIKVPGLGEISERPAVLGNYFRFDHTPPLFEMAYDAFGPRRMMWGSDYPPVSEREGYRNALKGVMEYPAFQQGNDLEWIMGKTALSVYKFDH